MFRSLNFKSICVVCLNSKMNVTFYGNEHYRLYCGSTCIIMLNGYDVIHEAFTKQADIFTDRPQLFAPLIGVSKGTGEICSNLLFWNGSIQTIRFTIFHVIIRITIPCNIYLAIPRFYITKVGYVVVYIFCPKT